MGIGPGPFAELVAFSRAFNPKGRRLMLGRQAFRMGQGTQKGVTDPAVYQKILDAHGLQVRAEDLKQDDFFAERMFEGIGLGKVEALDYSDYQDAALVWDLNQPVPPEWHGQFGFIYDGGTLEHVFDIPQAFENVFNMLQEGGVFIGANPFNGFPSHGMYQFSPELVWTYWKHACNCEVLKCRALARKGRYTRDLPDPTALGGRIPIKVGAAWRGHLPRGEVILWYEVRKTAESHPPQHVLQSDYVSTWTEDASQKQEVVS